jgi:hypothetical protein
LATDKLTRRTYSELQKAFDFFNGRLFRGELPSCVITLQRFHRSKGYYAPQAWENDDGSLSDEISLSPQYYDPADLPRFLSTLVHEMVHQWQAVKGKPGKHGYHNREWAQKMADVGLTPSTTGKKGGARTGRGVSHYIQPGGAFETQCSKLIAGGFALDWHNRLDLSRDPRRKAHYKCPKCEVSCWAKPDCRFVCGDCRCEMGEQPSRFNKIKGQQALYAHPA